MKITLILNFLFVVSISGTAQTKNKIIEKTGLIFFSSFYTYDSSGKFNHGIDYYDATDDYFIPIRNYSKSSKPIDLFRTDNLNKGFIMFSYPQRNRIIKRAFEYTANTDSSSCYFSSTYKLLLVKIRYLIISHNEATFCNDNKSIIFSKNRFIKFSYNGWGRKIIDIKPL